MEHPTDGPADDTGHHSHSRIRKILDEIDAVVTAARWNGTYEPHHRRELESFLDRLREVFEGHAEFEEEGLFEEIRPKLDEEGLEDLESVIDQHREFSDQLEVVEERFEQIEVGASAEDEPLRRLEEDVDELQNLWTRHDRAEGELFARISEGAPH